jgi:hypothetical protein
MPHRGGCPTATGTPAGSREARGQGRAVNNGGLAHEQTVRLGWRQDFGYDGRGYGYVRYCKERFVEICTTGATGDTAPRRRGAR